MDSEISESGESSVSRCGPYLDRVVQSDSMSIVPDPGLSSSIISGMEVPLASKSIILLVFLHIPYD